MRVQVGERVAKIRKNHNLSRAQFGKLLGVSAQYIGMLERGVHELSAALIVKICKSTGTSADYILFGTVHPTQDPDFTAALYGLSCEQIEIGLDIIKRMAKFINTNNGNNALIQEVLRRQRVNA